MDRKNHLMLRARLILSQLSLDQHGFVLTHQDSKDRISNRHKCFSNDEACKGAAQRCAVLFHACSGEACLYGEPEYAGREQGAGA